MLKNYIKIAWKVLLRRKFFTFVSLFGIVFTLLVLMVVAAFIDNIFSPGKAGSRFDRTLLVRRIELKAERSSIYSSPGYYFLDRYVRPMQQPEMVTFHSRTGEAVSYVRGRKLELSVKHADAVFWDVMEFDFLEGRPYDQIEVENADHVAVITQRTAEQAFGEGSAVGELFETSDGTFRVVGVIPQEQIPSEDAHADMYVPSTLDNFTKSLDRLYGRYIGYVVVPDGVDDDLVKQEFDQRMEQVREDFKGEYDSIACLIGSPADNAINHLMPGRTQVHNRSLVLGGIVILMVLFMLFPAINLVNINISRIIERSSEVGVRRAFGASKRALVGQFLVENIVLTLIGGAIAFVLSIFVLDAITSSGLIPFGKFGFNLKVFLYAVALCLFFGVFSGVLPAYRMSRLHPVEALKGGEA